MPCALSPQAALKVLPMLKKFEVRTHQHGPFTATKTPQNVAVAIRASLFGDEKDYKCCRRHPCGPSREQICCKTSPKRSWNNSSVAVTSMLRIMFCEHLTFFEDKSVYLKSVGKWKAALRPKWLKVLIKGNAMTTEELEMRGA